MTENDVRLAKVGNAVTVGSGKPLTLIAGPCVIENRDLVFEVAEAVNAICKKLGVQYIFKASFDKANRTSASTFRGPGVTAGLEVLQEVKDKLGLPVLTDIHESSHVEQVAEVVDVLQIPAFLCRQTDLLMAAAATGKAINVKKGQFLSPQEMSQVAQKLRTAGVENLMLTERGNSFGYNTLVVDFRSLPQLQSFGCPVIFDATHSVQQPGGQGGTSGGQREYVAPLARAAVAVGVDGLFMEIHPNPDKALSDGPNMLPLHRLEPLLKQLLAIRAPLIETGPMTSSI
ncbi:MAG: 2-dehydro-3-deoxyphosphooctonate aldolase [Actinomycetota bacterium]|jgi:2-dehydro-3-deoxyphosphooctonate aldolase (KDO 8-P synthase)